MPTYEYVCDACGRELELFQSMTEAPKKKCPECGKQKLRRRIGTGGGILFKGSGFYQTDYRSDSYKSAAKKDAPADGGKASPEAKPSSSSEAKPSSSSEAKPSRSSEARPKPAPDAKKPSPSE